MKVKSDIDSIFNGFEKTATKKEKQLIKKFKKELKEIFILKAQVEQERKDLSEQLEVLDDLKLEYSNMINVHKRAEPKGLYM